MVVGPTYRLPYCSLSASEKPFQTAFEIVRVVHWGLGHDQRNGKAGCAIARHPEPPDAARGLQCGTHERVDENKFDAYQTHPSVRHVLHTICCTAVSLTLRLKRFAHMFGEQF
jgi:hypothetical protein